MSENLNITCPYQMDLFIKYRNINENKIVPLKLQRYIIQQNINNKQIPFNITSMMKQNNTKFKNTWLMTNKTNQNENDKISGLIKSTLNKISKDNFDIQVEEIMNIGIQTAEQLQELVDLICDKAINETMYSNMYSRLCVSLMPCYIENNNNNNNNNNQENNNKIYLREILVSRCQKDFNNLINIKTENSNQKYKVMGCIRFIGELFNCGILTSQILYFCLIELMKCITTKKPYAIENLCNLVTISGDCFLKKDKQKADSVINKIRELIECDEITKRDKFMLEDVVTLFDK